MKIGCKPDVFWESKKLEEMTNKEWESLCDGCGICCLFKVEDAETNELFYTNVACGMLDLETGRCMVYKQRSSRVKRCVDLVKTPAENFKILPPTCAYRRLSQGEKLSDWHPLISENEDSVEQAGFSVKGKVLPETEIDINGIEQFILEKGISDYLQKTKKT